MLSRTRSQGTDGVDERAEQLVLLLTSNYARIYRYIFALVPEPTDARDIVQDTCVALCRKFGDYDPAQPFLPWAYRFAYLEVLKYRKRKSQESQMLSPDVVELLARERPSQDDDLQARLRALDACLDTLGDADRALIRHRYHGDEAMDEVAARLRMSRRTLFYNLKRIRHLLFECVDRRLAAEAFP